MSLTNQDNPLQLALDRNKRNPLLARLPNWMSPVELATRLRTCIIKPEYVQAIRFHDRQGLVIEYENIYIPTMQGLAIALSLQKMIRDGYARRDPLEASARKFIYEGGQLKGQKLSDAVWWPSFASGTVIDGITGLGKSQIVDRFLSLYPQTIEHGENKDCGWKSLKQLCWLKVHMPSDGSRGGFLTDAFIELDKALGTDYCKQYSSRSWTVEKLLVVFMHLLVVHRCGLLVIEEAQEKNLIQAPFSREFLTFFLRMLNFGVPTVLMGNPLAFANLGGFSQDVDRFTEGGWHHLLPILDPTSEEWVEDWIPSLWMPTLLDHPDAEYTPFSDAPIDQTLAGFVWRRTGGVPRYLARLRMDVQNAALQSGLRQITPDLVDLVYRTSPKLIKIHGRIDALVRRDWRALKQFKDIPWNDYRKLWEPSGPEDDERDMAPASTTPDTKLKGVAKRRAVQGKPRVTKDNPTPPDKLSAKEIQARQFQESVIENLTRAAGLSSE